MNENQNQNQIQNLADDEIDLRELIAFIWKKKVVIIAIALIAAVITGLFSMFVLTPVYDTRLNIVINMPETYHTRYGDYTLPITSNEQYINLITSNDVILNTIRDMGYDTDEVTVDTLRKSISIETGDAKTNVKQNSFIVKVSADSPQKSLKLAENLYENYIDFLDAMTKERAISYYENYFNVQIITLENSLTSVTEILKRNEELLAQTPQTINQKEAMQAVKEDLPNTSGFVVLENIINPNYTKIEADIVGNKQSINSMENSIEKYKTYLNEIAEEKKLIDEYYKTGKASRLETSIIGVVETSVYLPSPPVAPTKKTSPSNAKNAIIGGLLGGMLAVAIVFIKDYWWKKA